MVGITNERRDFPRAAFTGITLVRAGRQEIPCVAGNLSESGILLYPQLTRDPGPAFRVTFTLPSVSRWIDLKGTLVRRNRVRRRTEWGIRFVNVPTEVRTALRSYVTEKDFTTPSTGPAIPVEEIPLPPPVPVSRSARATEPLRKVPTPTSQQVSPPARRQRVAPGRGNEVDLTPPPIPAPTDVGPDTPTRMTLKDDIDDVGATDVPTVATPRGVVLASDNPTRMANAREASALRDRCRRN
jgi:hypothetical protein